MSCDRPGLSVVVGETRCSAFATMSKRSDEAQSGTTDQLRLLKVERVADDHCQRSHSTAVNRPPGWVAHDDAAARCTCSA